MKRRLLILLSLATITVGAQVSANPIKSPYVCVPTINPTESPLEFRIRESSACGEGETLMKVQSQKDGTILIYPAPLPPPPEETDALEAYKKYHGITP